MVAQRLPGAFCQESNERHEEAAHWPMIKKQQRSSKVGR
jgi:hypothetical protein